MCYNPIHLSNKGKQVNNRISADGVISSEIRYAYDVPCGKCESCKKSKRDSYLLRCMAEFQRSQEKACFFTLTYNNINLPRIVNYSTPIFSPDGELLERSKKYTRSVWNKKHIQAFFKSLNEQLIYHIGTDVLGLQRLVTINGRRRISDSWKDFLLKCPRPIKYICVCERGKANIYLDKSGNNRKGSRRPHYHSIVFVTHPALSCEFVLKKANELWNYGLTYNIMVGSGLYNSSFGKKSILRDITASLKYVTKYITKDVVDIAENLAYPSHESELIHKPFVLMSNGIGDNILDGLNDSEMLNKIVNGVTIQEDNNARNIPVPRYNLLKSKMYVRHYVGDFVTSRLKPVEVEFDKYSKPIINDSNELEYHLYPKYETYLTDFGQRVNKRLLISKCDFYEKLLYDLQQDPSAYLSLSKQFPKLLPNDSYGFIHEVTTKDFRNYVEQLYCHYDNHVSDDICYKIYLLLRNFNVALSKLKRTASKIEYKQKLEKALLNKKELFNLTPL